ncbi:MAG: LCP family protein, partial [Oscillospiraceae bacterium]|nr:LCP family protein [Oscillospiraceae bacterium]
MKLFGGLRRRKRDELIERELDAASESIDLEKELDKLIDDDLEQPEQPTDEDSEDFTRVFQPVENADGEYSEEEYHTPEEDEEIEEMIFEYQRRKKRRRVIICSVLAALLIGAVVGYASFVKPPPIKESTYTNKPLPTDASEEVPEEPPLGDDEEQGDKPDVQSGVKTRREGIRTFLLIGMEQSFANTDTLMVGVIDTNEKTVNIVSIPRDTCANVVYESKKINGVYAYSGGIDGLIDAVTDITGFPIDSYIMVNIQGFVSLVDTVGGVNFNVPYYMNYDDPTQNLHIHFNTGEQYLTGSDAVKVVRWRQNNDGSNYGDIVRIQTQQDFLKTIIKKCLSLSNLATKLKDYIDIFKTYVTTDLTTGNLLWYGEQFLKMSSDSFRFHTLPSNYYDSIKGFSYGTILVDDWLELLNESFNPFEEEIKLEDL